MSAAVPGLGADGRCVIRAARPGDEAAARAFFLEALSPASRYRRFLAPLRELPQLPARYGRHDACEALVLYARVDGRVIGVGEYVAEPGSSRIDLAVAVADAWQGCGIGAALVGRLVAMARRAGFRRAEADLLSDNDAMARILRRAGFVLRAEPGAAAWTHAALELQAAYTPTATSARAWAAASTPARPADAARRW